MSTSAHTQLAIAVPSEWCEASTLLSSAYTQRIDALLCDATASAAAATSTTHSPSSLTAAAACLCALCLPGIEHDADEDADRCGGLPSSSSWPHALRWPRCQCNQPMSFLVQINATRDDCSSNGAQSNDASSEWFTMIYVFACVFADCQVSNDEDKFVVYRIVVPIDASLSLSACDSAAIDPPVSSISSIKPKLQPKQLIDCNSNDWGVNADDWGDNNDDDEAADDRGTTASVAPPTTIEQKQSDNEDVDACTPFVAPHSARPEHQLTQQIEQLILQQVEVQSTPAIAQDVAATTSNPAATFKSRDKAVQLLNAAEVSRCQQHGFHMLRPYYLAFEDASVESGMRTGQYSTKKKIKSDVDSSHEQHLLRQYELALAQDKAARTSSLAKLSSSTSGSSAPKDEAADVTLEQNINESDFEAEEDEENGRDEVFESFCNEIQKCPQQVLRWQTGGKPLFASTASSNATQNVRACDCCGQKRQLELSLMPNFLNEMQWLTAANKTLSTTTSSNSKIPAAMAAIPSLDFLVVHIYTCQNARCMPSFRVRESQSHDSNATLLVQGASREVVRVTR